MERRGEDRHSEQVKAYGVRPKAQVEGVTLAAEDMAPALDAEE